MRFSYERLAEQIRERNATADRRLAERLIDTAVRRITSITPEEYADIVDACPCSAVSLGTEHAPGCPEAAES